MPDKRGPVSLRYQRDRSTLPKTQQTTLPYPELIARGSISKHLRAADQKKVTGDLLRNALTEKERNSFKQIPTS